MRFLCDVLPDDNEGLLTRPLFDELRVRCLREQGVKRWYVLGGLLAGRRDLGTFDFVASGVTNFHRTAATASDSQAGPIHSRWLLAGIGNRVQGFTLETDMDLPATKCPSWFWASMQRSLTFSCLPFRRGVTTEPSITIPKILHVKTPVPLRTEASLRGLKSVADVRSSPVRTIPDPHENTPNRQGRNPWKRTMQSRT